MQRIYDEMASFFLHEPVFSESNGASVRSRSRTAQSHAFCAGGAPAEEAIESVRPTAPPAVDDGERRWRARFLHALAHGPSGGEEASEVPAFVAELFGNITAQRAGDARLRTAARAQSHLLGKRDEVGIGEGEPEVRIGIAPGPPPDRTAPGRFDRPPIRRRAIRKPNGRLWENTQF